LSQANENTAVIIQIETLAAYKSVEEFAKIKGVGNCRIIHNALTVDVLFIGPFDLSNALGHPLVHGVEHPVVSEAIQKILDTAHNTGIKAGIFTTSHDDARKRVEQGFDMVHIATDVNITIAGVAAGVSAAWGKAPASAKGGY
jgi:4-hydroxy-2-oxoheptanedioate aldolase